MDMHPSNNRMAPIKVDKSYTSDLVILTIGIFLIYLVVKFFDFIFSPLKRHTQEEISDQVDEAIKQKRENRRLKRKKSLPSNDPMEQFYLRFVSHPEEYKNDIDNDVYSDWFDAWKKGKIIDSDLRWAPDIFKGILDDDTLRPGFVQYMKIQLALHKRTSLLHKMVFTNTIFRFYPELTAGLKGLEEDLAHYETENDEDGAVSDLMDEIKAFGLPDELAEYLINKDTNARTLRKEAVILKEHTDNGFSPETCICALENKVKNQSYLKVIDKMTTEAGLPARAAMARINEQITDEQLLELITHMEDLRGSWGMDIYEPAIDGDGETHYDQFVDGKLNEYKGKNLLNQRNKK